MTKKMRTLRGIKKMQNILLLAHRYDQVSTYFKFEYPCVLFTQSIQVATGDENWSKNTKMGLEEAVTKEMT